MIKKDSGDIFAIQIADAESKVMSEVAKLCQSSGAEYNMT